MIEYILKRISKGVYNKHKRDYGYCIKPYYKKGHGLLYQINNPPDGFRYYKIVGEKHILLCPSGLSEKFIQVVNDFIAERRKAHRK